MNKRHYLIIALVIVLLFVAAYSQELHPTEPHIVTETQTMHDFELPDYLSNMRALGYSQFTVYARHDKETSEWIYDVNSTKILP